MAGGRIEIDVEPQLKDFPSKLEKGLKGSSNVAGTIGKGIGIAFAAGVTGAGIALSSIIKLGVEYTDNLNSLQAVTQATGLQMRQVSETATKLGSDLTLPATSAADAAAAMLELAKGGLTVEQAMTAAKGTLQLAAAAQIDGAQAAEIQANALQAFGLSAESAGHVSDVLANSANAASGEITDFAFAMAAVGAVAHQLGVSLDDTSTALALLANAGIKGSDAGTLLKSALLALSSPSKPAREAMRDLGLTAFDATGKFVGLESIVHQLHDASKRLTQQQYAAAASTLFGSDAARLAGVAAGVTAEQWDQMAMAISRTGGAADVAASKTKGLGGAVEGFTSQVETAGLLIFDAIDGPLEGMVRSAAEHVAELAPVVAGGIENAVQAGQFFGPALGAAIRDRGDAIGDAARDVLQPLAHLGKELANSGLNIAINLFEEFTDLLRGATKVVKPIAEGIGDLAESLDDAGGPLAVVTTGIDLLGDAGGVALAVIRPIAEVVGTLISAFGDLPGPVQSAVLAMLALRLVRGPVDDLAGSVSGRLTGAWRGFNEEMRLQQALLTGSTQIISANVSQLGLAAAALEARSPALRAMGDSFRSASEGATRFATAQGLAASAGTGLKLAGGSLVSFLGGPWGVAMGVATIGLGLLASSHQKAAEAAKRSEAGQKDFSRALIASGGALNDAIRDLAFKRAEDEKAIDNAKTLGISYADVTDAVLGQSGAYDKLQAQLKATIIAETQQLATKGGTVTALTEKGEAAQALLASLGLLNSEYKKGGEDAEAYAAAQRQSGDSMLESTDSGRSLADAMAILSDNTASADDRSRALKDALDALSGNQVDYEQAVSRLREQTSRLGEAFTSAATEAKAAGVGILDAGGRINTTTEAGRNLLDITDDLAVSMADAATATFEYARTNGDDVTTALAKAQEAAGAARVAFLAAAASAGVGAAQAIKLADAYDISPDVVTTLIEQPGMTKAQLELLLLKQRVDEVPNGKTITVKSLSDEARQKLIDLGVTVKTLPDGRVEVTANTQAARDALNSFLAAPATKVVQIVYRGEQAFRTPGGSIGLASGGMVKAYASGGVHQLTPMKAGIARIVPPNTWRVVGDRLRDDEAYIPLNNSRRSRDLLELAARRMGYAAVRMFAEGGIASSGSTPVPRGPVSVDAGFHVQSLHVTDLDELMRRQREEQSLALMRAGLL